VNARNPIHPIPFPGLACVFFRVFRFLRVLPFLSLLFGLLGSLAALTAPAYGQSELFRRLSLEAEGGYAFPGGNLAPILDPVPEFGLRITSSYYGPLRAHARLHVSRPDGAGSPAPVTLATGGVGLEWRGPSGWPASRAWMAWLPAPGLGVSLHYARVSPPDEPAEREFFMEDGESEFGFYPFLRWHIPLGPPGGAFFLVADLRQDIMLTEPRYSRLFSTHIGAGWQWK
jgi:hypothetical protein